MDVEPKIVIADESDVFAYAGVERGSADLDFSESRTAAANVGSSHKEPTVTYGLVPPPVGTQLSP